MNNIGIGLEIMGTGMLGLFVAMIVIMVALVALAIVITMKSKRRGDY